VFLVASSLRKDNLLETRGNRAYVALRNVPGMPSYTSRKHRRCIAARSFPPRLLKRYRYTHRQVVSSRIKCSKRVLLPRVLLPRFPRETRGISESSRFQIKIDRSLDTRARIRIRREYRVRRRSAGRVIERFPR